jgi:hypothetical protein
MCMEHYMNELLIDEVCIFWTSSMDCAYTTMMSKWNMFMICFLRGLQHGATYFFFPWQIKHRQSENTKCVEYIKLMRKCHN